MLVEKEVIRPGVYFYKDQQTGEPRKLVVTPELTRYWHEQGNAMLSQGLTVPLPCEHDFDAHPMTPAEKLKNNAGWVKEYQIKNNRLYAVTDIQDAELAKKLPTTIRYTSPWINSFTDGNGKEWKNVISHLALTTRPRIVNQEPFGSVAAALSMATMSSLGAATGAGGFCLSRAGLLNDNGLPEYPIAFSLVAGIPMATDASGHEHGKGGRFTGSGGGKAAAEHFGIKNPNSTGHQGHADSHKDNQHHGTLTKHGYEYTHSTPIGHADGSYSLHHSYRHKDDKDDVVGVSEGKWDSHRLGSGRRTSGNHSGDLDKHLRNKRRSRKGAAMAMDFGKKGRKPSSQGGKPDSNPTPGEGKGDAQPDDDFEDDEEGDDDIPDDGNPANDGTVDLKPFGDPGGDVSMSELLCDLLGALGIHCEHDSNEEMFKRNLYNATMTKIHELTGKAQNDQNRTNPPGQPPNNPQGKGGQPGQNPLIQQEQQPMYMSLDDINKLDEPLKSVALSMYNETVKANAKATEAEKLLNSLRDAKLKEATDARAKRVALLGKLSPRAKTDLDAMLALPAMALSMGEGGMVVDPMAQTLAVLEKGLADMPRLLTADATALSVQPQPQDADMMSDEKADAIADNFARQMGCTPITKAS